MTQQDEPAEPAGDPVGPRARTGQPSDASAEQDLVRSGGVMAAGTLVSRITGMLRDSVMVAAVGAAVFADAYNVANVVPNILYILLIGGVLNTVFLPQLVRAMKEDADGGEAYAQRLLTVVVLVLAVVSVVAVLAAPLIVAIYTGADWSGQDREVTTTLARLCLPQIFFYGLFAMFSQVLNSRGRFGPPMWAPIYNNVVVIVVGVVFMLVATGTPTTSTVETWQLVLLGAGTTLGIVVQSLALLPPLRRVGFRLRLRFDLRGAGLRRAGSLGLWTLLFVVINQIGYVVITRIGTATSKAAEAQGIGGVGFTVYSKAYLLFILPHSLITVSLITALLPRMSAHHVDQRGDLIRDDMSSGIRLIGVALVPMSVLVVLLGPSIGALLYSWGASGSEGARHIGVTLSVFALGMVPFSLFYAYSRACYAQEDTRTPALVVLVINAVNITGVLAVASILPVETRVYGMALSYGFAYVVGATVLITVVRRGLGGIDGFRVTRAYVRVTVAALVAAIPTAAVVLAADALIDSTLVEALVGISGGAAVFAAVFLPLASRMRIAEVRTVTTMIRERLPR